MLGRDGVEVDGASIEGQRNKAAEEDMLRNSAFTVIPTQ
jgi:hypothetical protein